MKTVTGSAVSSVVSKDRQRLEFWRQRLEVSSPVHLERVSIWQVVREDGRRGCSLVGIVFSAEEACLYHTRRLTEEDIVHELLHVAHPRWSEAEVVAETARLLTVSNVPQVLPHVSSSYRAGNRAGNASGRQFCPALSG